MKNPHPEGMRAARDRWATSDGPVLIFQVSLTE
jgi:hypothetical protein